MSYDFNESNYKNGQVNYGPAPFGSRLLVKLMTHKVKVHSDDESIIFRSKSGLLFLSLRVEVVAGTYKGMSWFQNIPLPKKEQTIELSEGQAKACLIGEGMFRRIIDAANKFKPEDESNEAKNRRIINDWTDFDNVIVPVKVGINNWSYKDKRGITRWRNLIHTIITPDNIEYDTLMKGGEYITDGYVSMETSTPTSGYVSTSKDSINSGSNTFTTASTIRYTLQK